MKESKITVVKVEPMRHPEIVYLDNDLDSLQKAVSIGADHQGLVELISLDDNTLILCNEEAKLIGLEPNRRIGHDIICGTFYVVSEDYEGNLSSLSPAMQDRYQRLFWDIEVISNEELDMIPLCTFLS